MRKVKETNHILLAIIAISLSSCISENFIQKNMDEDVVIKETNQPVEEDIFTNFDFQTIQKYTINLHAVDFDERALEGVYIELYDEYPFNEYGVLTEEKRRKRIFSGITDEYGNISVIINPPKTRDSLYIKPFFVGLHPLYSIPLHDDNINVTIGDVNPSDEDESSGITNAEVRSITVPSVNQIDNTYYTLGTWNSKGKPNYMEPGKENLSNAFLTAINNSLPESQRLPISHPDYLANDMDANLELIEDGLIYVTFVTEGAGYQNILGYFTYPTNNPPASAEDITDLTIIFPNVSRPNPLQPGRKVQLYYLDQSTNTYSETFPEGTSVGWFIIANGWTNFNRQKYYSIPSFNPETSAEERKHNVLLYDEDTERLILAFEDLNRCCGDDDFNDVVFFATVTPPEAIDISDYQPTDDDVDADDDGVSDIFDDYPSDPTRAFDNYYPSEGQYSSIAFEDLWPSRGDYDFNDLVIDYQFNTVTNASNKAVEILIKTKIKAIGAGFHNALGLEMDINPSLISSISGNRIDDNYLTFNANGTESGQSKAVIILSDNVYRVLLHPGIGLGINTEESAPYVTPVEFTTTISFNSPMSLNSIGAPPFNPFIIINKNRGMEVHLPNNPPTDLVDASLFGTGQDDTDPNSNKYYVSDSNLPWALNIPSDWEHPAENKIITNTYLKFEEWATSGGASYDDWYEDKEDYRNPEFIFKKE